MAAKKTSELVPLCHPILITHVSVELEVNDGEEKRPLQPEGQAGESGDVNEPRESEKTSIPWQGTGQGDAYPFHSTKLSTPPFCALSDGQRAFGRVDITATVQCDGKTGVEMEALTAASIAALTVYDMCKAVDKGMRVESLRVVRKEGGKSGVWVQEEHVEVRKE